MTPQERLETIIRMAGEGATDEAIGDELRVSRVYASVIRSAFGILSAKQQRVNAMILDLKDHAQSFHDIAKRHKFTITTVYRTAKRIGVPPRGRVQSNMEGV